MNLHELHTPHPLRDADFAAIRARVKAEVARREERPWLAVLLRLAFAASLVVLFVPYVQHRAPEVPVVVERRSGPPASPPADVRASRPHQRTRDAYASAAGTAAVRRRRQPPARTAHAERIEIITADPTIRIIWITPKENS